MKRLIFLLLLFAAPSFAQTKLGINHGGTGPWNSTDAGKALISNGTSAPSWQPLSVTTYTVTETNASNTASTTSVLSISVPANTWADGQVIEFDFIAQTLNNSGGSLTLKEGNTWNGNSWLSTSGTSFGSFSSVGQSFRRFYAIRVGSSIYFADERIAWGAVSPESGGAPGTNDNFIGANGHILTSQSFTSTASLTLDVQWSGANASTYYDIVWARAFKINN